MTSRRVPTWAPRRWEVSSTVAFNHKHLIDITEYSEEDIKLILETAKAFSEVNERAIKKVPTLKGKTIVNMFNEPSTHPQLFRARREASFGRQS